MNRAFKSASGLAVMLLALAAPLTADEPRVVSWSGTDRTGAAVSVPAADRPSAMLFVRAEQLQSRRALQQLREVVRNAGHADAQVVVVVSGRSAAEQAAKLARDEQIQWPVVVDPDYEISGPAGVHVWPTTLVVRPDGVQTAHIAGLPKSYTVDVRAHLDHAADRLDDNGLAERLATRQVVTDSPEHVGVRHLQVAQRMADKGRLAEARAELAEAIPLLPDDPPLQLQCARLLLAVDQPAEAMAVLQRIPADAVPIWQISLLRSRAGVQLGQWETARATLPQALRLNPDPAEAHYLMGLVHQHDGKPADAAASFRAAYEAAAPATKIDR